MVDLKQSGSYMQYIVSHFPVIIFFSIIIKRSLIKHLNPKVCSPLNFPPYYGILLNDNINFHMGGGIQYFICCLPVCLGPTSFADVT